MLFGGQDIYLPVITQLMQVDADSSDEIKAFYSRVYCLASLENVRSNLIKPSMVTEEARGDFADLDMREVYDAEMIESVKLLERATEHAEETGEELPLASLARVVRQVQEILTTIGDTGMIPGRLLMTLRESVPLSTNRLSLRSYAWKSDITYEDVEMFPLHELTTYQWFAFANPTYFIVWSLEELLLALWRYHKRLDRCEECTSVYVAERSNARFCSYRCSSRAGKRRRRAERKQQESIK